MHDSQQETAVNKGPSSLLLPESCADLLWPEAERMIQNLISGLRMIQNLISAVARIVGESALKL